MPVLHDTETLLGVLDAMDEARRYAAWIRRQFAPAMGRRILELGPGVGTMTAEWLQCADDVVAVDIDAESANRTRSRFPGEDRLHVAVGDVLEEGTVARLRERGGAFDTAVLVNVLEHIPDDVGTLRAVASTVRPGGSLCVLVPALPALFGPLDEAVGHVRRYRRAGLIEVFAAAGVSLESVRWMNAPGVLAWWWQAKVRRTDVLTRRAVRFYDALIPAISGLERAARPPFGQSLVAVGRTAP